MQKTLSPNTDEFEEFEAAWDRGFRAYERNETIASAPLVHDFKRNAWLAGWHTARDWSKK
jgi:hypothetical protein